MSAGWSRDSVAEVLEEQGVPTDAVLMVHSNPAWLGRPTTGTLATELLEGLRISAARTLLLPAFTYSFGRGELFNPAVPPTNMGVLSIQAMRCGYQRSLDPMFSFLGTGPRADILLGNLSGRSFGEGSTFARLKHENAYLITVNLDAGSTFLHNLEHDVRVAHRFEKSFRGSILTGGEVRPLEWMSYVRDLCDPASEADFTRLTQDLRDHGLWRPVRLGRGFVSAIPLKTYSEFVLRRLKHDESYLARGGSLQRFT